MNTPVDLRSPYQPPASDLAQGPPELPVLQPHERSGAPKVFGVLSIIFASLILLSSAVGVLFSLAAGMVSDLGSQAGETADAAAAAAMMQPLAKVYQGFGLQSMILFVMSILLLVIGIGQVRYRAWACRWSVYWGAAGLVCVGLMVAISMLIVSPGYAAFLDSLSHIKPQEGQAPMPSLGPMSAFVGGTFAVVNVIVYAPYPALMLMFFTRERVRASMTT
ncbi:MAG TPA: hypothetical protein VN903_11030 [Polyangia bacterium]|jgi:hypothetical protein|nr:hypothetical protein [Polyangia bacterium]